MTFPRLPGGLTATGRFRQLSDGPLATVWRVILTDGTDAVVKRTTYDATAEADGLRALAAAGAPVPEVLGTSTDVLVMTFVQGRPDWERLGATLAAVHRDTGTCFGWTRDNVIGALPQRNRPTGDWATFYADERLRPHLEHPALPEQVRYRIERAIDGPLPTLLDHEPLASLVHGDLWAGNIVDGAYLIDPAVHHADREFELAFMALFGGIPRSMWAAYEEAWPLDGGWQRRRPALQLYHLLVHVGLFGASYVAPIVTRLDQLGW